jgi:hypothetical protein
MLQSVRHGDSPPAGHDLLEHGAGDDSGSREIGNSFESTSRRHPPFRQDRVNVGSLDPSAPTVIVVAGLDPAIRAPSPVGG